MFERNRVDNVMPQQRTTVPAEITLDDGELLKGKFLLPVGASVYDQLNGANAFLEFEPYGGDRQLIAKTSIRAVKLVTIPGNNHLRNRQSEVDGFDPFGVLGLKAGAGWDDIKAAYHRTAKVYHPDRYANAELPLEVRDYLAAMARRVNAAYAALENQEQSRRIVAERAQPVFTSRPRA